MKNIIHYFVLTLLLVSCTKKTDVLKYNVESGTNLIQQQIEKVSTFIFNPFQYEIGNNTKYLISNITNNIGQPIDIKKDSITNRFDTNSLDYIYTLNYEGLELSIYEVTEDSRQMVLAMNIFSGKYILKYKLKVGDNYSLFENEFGNKLAKTSNNIITYFDESYNNSINLCLNNNIVTNISFIFYID